MQNFPTGAGCLLLKSLTFGVTMIYARSLCCSVYIGLFRSKEIIPSAFYRWFHAINPT